MDEIKTKIDWIDKVNKVKQMFETDFKGSLDDFEKLYKRMDADKDFQGEATEGFLEVFDIMLQYQKDLIEELPDVYKAFKTYKTELNELKQEAIYTELDS